MSEIGISGYSGKKTYLNKNTAAEKTLLPVVAVTLIQGVAK
jgi:hypothetical protein